MHILHVNREEERPVNEIHGDLSYLRLGEWQGMEPYVSRATKYSGALLAHAVRAMYCTLQLCRKWCNTRRCRLLIVACKSTGPSWWSWALGSL
eukprot:3912345-Karenia_brevis.AAC.1